MPVFGYGYLTFVIPTVEHGFAFPADTWQESITMRYWWSAWMVLGVDTSVDPPNVGGKRTQVVQEGNVGFICY